MATSAKAYTHRSGRTARAGAVGDVVTVMTRDQAGDVRTLARQAGIRPTITSVRPGDGTILALSGPHAPLVTPRPPPPSSLPCGPGPGRTTAAPVPRPVAAPPLQQSSR